MGSDYHIVGNIGRHKIWQICHERHLARFKFGRSQVPDWWCHKMATLLRLEPSSGCFRHREVPSSPSRTVFSSVSSYLCPVFTGIVSIGAARVTLCFVLTFASSSTVCLMRSFLFCLLLCESAALEHRPFPLQIRTFEVQQGHIDCNVRALLRNGWTYWQGIKLGRFSENHQTV